MDGAERRDAARERLQRKAAAAAEHKAVEDKENEIRAALESTRLKGVLKDTPEGYEMVTGTMMLPEGAKPGDKLNVALPSGEYIIVVVPREAKQGKKFTFGFHQQKRDKGLPPRHDGRMLEHTFTVPNELQPGAVMAVLALPWGQELDLKVPDGCKPGEEFALKIPVPEGFGKDPNVYERTIKVPPDWTHGHGPVNFKLPWGETLSLKVPAGGKVGDNLMIEIPFPSSYQPPWRAMHAAKLAKQAAAAAVTAGGDMQAEIPVPPGKKAGDRFQIDLPNGKQFEVEVPPEEECKDGMFKVVIPAGAGTSPAGAEGVGAAATTAAPPAAPAAAGDSKKKKKKKGKK